ncbi:MAG: hypothetical protein ACHQ49_07940 [Elusimicrobiota bacterium]
MSTSRIVSFSRGADLTAVIPSLRISASLTALSRGRIAGWPLVTATTAARSGSIVVTR